MKKFSETIIKRNSYFERTHELIARSKATETEGGFVRFISGVLVTYLPLILTIINCADIRRDSSKMSITTG